jgi:hypothetical protein
MENTLKEYNVLGEYTKSILPYMENTSRGIKSSLYLDEFSARFQI